MEHIYPAFERGRIMKKELLWALRDYSYTALQLQYADYPDGILSGCKIRVEDDALYITPGMIKCSDFIFLIAEEEKMVNLPVNCCASLKFRLKKKESLPDYIRYVTEFVFDENIKRHQNELELCRFKLKEGARLRTDYKDFFDIQTEYDTVNLANATWSSCGGNTLSKEITDCFARKVLECRDADDKDAQFAYLMLQSKDAVNYAIITDYILRKTGGKGMGVQMDTEEAFRKLEEILEGIRRGTDIYKRGQMGQSNRMIVMD